MKDVYDTLIEEGYSFSDVEDDEEEDDGISVEEYAKRIKKNSKKLMRETLVTLLASYYKRLEQLIMLEEKLFNEFADYRIEPFFRYNIPEKSAKIQAATLKEIKFISEELESLNVKCN